MDFRYVSLILLIALAWTWLFTGQGSAGTDHSSEARHAAASDSLTFTIRPDSEGPKYRLRPRIILRGERRGIDAVGVSNFELTGPDGTVTQRFYTSDTLWYSTPSIERWVRSIDYTFDGYSDFAITINEIEAQVPQYDVQDYYRWVPSEEEFRWFGQASNLSPDSESETLNSISVHRVAPNFLFERRWFDIRSDTLRIIQSETQRDLNTSISQSSQEVLGRSNSDLPVYLRQFHIRQSTNEEEPTKLVHSALITVKEADDQHRGYVAQDTLTLYGDEEADIIDLGESE